MSLNLLSKKVLLSLLFLVNSVRSEAQNLFISAVPITSSNIKMSTISLTLTEAVAIGLRNNRTIRSSFLFRTSEKFDLKVAENKFVPQLSMTTSFLSVRDSASGRSNLANITPLATVMLPTGGQLSSSWSNSRVTVKNQRDSSSSVLSYSLIQPLLRNAGLDIAMSSVQMARVTEKINILNLKDNVEQTVLQIIFSYRDLLRAQDQLKISEEGLKRSKTLLDINKALINAGRMADIDLIQAEADEANQEVSVEEATNQLDSIRLTLLSLLAMESRTPVVAIDKLLVKAPRVDVNETLAMAFENQPRYLSTLLSFEFAKTNLMIAKNQRLWDLSVVAGATNSRNTPIPSSSAEQTGSRNNYVGLQLTIPFNDLTLEQSEINAKANLDNKTIEIEESRQSLEQNIRDATRNVQTRWRQLEISQRARDLSIKKLYAEQEKLKVGRSSNFQVLSFEGDLRNSESGLLNTTIAYLNSLTILEQQQGKLLDIWKITLND